MTLLLMTAAAVTGTLVWYQSEKAKKMHLGRLCLSYWGAALMWMVDALAAYLEEGTSIFNPSLQEMVNDSFLGFAVIVLGLAVWTVVEVSRGNWASSMIEDKKNS